MKKVLLSVLVMGFIAGNGRGSQVPETEGMDWTLHDTTHLHIGPSGYQTWTVDRQYHILSEKGRIRPTDEDFAGFDKKTRPILMYTENEGIRSEAKKLETHVAFTQCQIGSKLRWKYRSGSKAPWDGNISGSLGFFSGDNKCHEMILPGSCFIVRSQIPLNFQMIDEEKLEILKQTPTELHVVLKVPLKEPKNQHASSIFNQRRSPGVIFSAQNSWTDWVRPLSDRYYKRLQEPLPDRFQDIVDSVPNNLSEWEILNHLTAALQERTSYHTDSRTQESCIFPNSLEKMSETLIMDCKDNAIAIGAMIRHLGFSTFFAFINRSRFRIMVPDSLPYYFFDHVLLKVEGPSGKSYWVEPTTCVSMAQMPQSDMIGKTVLIVSDQEAHLENVPVIKPEENRNQFEKTFQFSKDKVRAISKVQVTGLFAKSVMEQLIQNPTCLKDHILSAFSGPLQDDDYSFSLSVNPGDRHVKDVTWEVDMPVDTPLTFGNYENFTYKTDELDTFIACDPKVQVNDIHLGVPCVYNQKRFFKGTRAFRLERLNLDISGNPWIQVRRWFTQEPEGVLFHEEIKFLSQVLYAEEIQGEAFKELRKKLLGIQSFTLTFEE